MCSPAMGYMSGFIWTGLHSVSGKTLHETPHIPHQCNQFDNPPTTSKYINGYNGMNVKTGWWFQPTPLKNMSSSVGMIIPYINPYIMENGDFSFKDVWIILGTRVLPLNLREYYKLG